VAGSESEPLTGPVAVASVMDSGNANAAVVAEDVSRVHGETVALEGVSLAVDEGEVYALVGPNGAGKTTLVRALTGTTDCEGRVALFGGPPRAVDRSRIGLLPQSFAPPERLTARELVAYYAGLYDDARPVEAVLDDAGMSDDDDTRYERLSGGQRRRTCVATTLVNAPDLLVLDEPTTGIDPGGRRALWRLLEELAAGGTTVLLTTHDMEEAERLADRVGFLADGRLVAEGTPADLIAEHGDAPRLAARLDTTGERDSRSPPAVERAREALVAAELGRVTTEGREVVVHDADARAIGRALDALDGAGVAYDAVAWRQPDLESVYLALTGTDVTATGAAVAAGAPASGTSTPLAGVEPGTGNDEESGNGHGGGVEP